MSEASPSIGLGLMKMFGTAAVDRSKARLDKDTKKPSQVTVGKEMEIFYRNKLKKQEMQKKNTEKASQEGERAKAKAKHSAHNYKILEKKLEAERAENKKKIEKMEEGCMMFEKKIIKMGQENKRLVDSELDLMRLVKQKDDQNKALERKVEELQQMANNPQREIDRSMGQLKKQE